MRAEFLNLENVFSREGEDSEGTHSRADLQEAIAFPRPPIAEENFSFTAFLGTFLSRGTATEAIALARRALFTVPPTNLEHRRFRMSDLRLKHGTWVVVADGEKALIMHNKGDALYPDLEVIREIEEENPPTREQGSDRPGRFNDGPSPHKSAVADTDWHRVAKERFADEIAAKLYRFVHRGDFTELVLVAPPLVLGEMRKKLHKEVSDAVIAEVPKTLTNHPLPEIEKILLAA
jgi:protein required for attachment to host cells